MDGRGRGRRCLTLSICTDLDALHDALVARPQQTQPPVLPHLALAVVVVDAHRDADAAGTGAGTPGGALHQAVPLPGYRGSPVSFQWANGESKGIASAVTQGWPASLLTS